MLSGFMINKEYLSWPGDGNIDRWSIYTGWKLVRYLLQSYTTGNSYRYVCKYVRTIDKRCWENFKLLLCNSSGSFRDAMHKNDGVVIAITKAFLHIGTPVEGPLAKRLKLIFESRFHSSSSPLCTSLKWYQKCFQKQIWANSKVFYTFQGAVPNISK